MSSMTELLAEFARRQSALETGFDCALRCYAAGVMLRGSVMPLAREWESARQDGEAEVRAHRAAPATIPLAAPTMLVSEEAFARREALKAALASQGRDVTAFEGDRGLLVTSVAQAGGVPVYYLRKAGGRLAAAQDSAR